jgi:hypothetical protein
MSNRLCCSISSDGLILRLATWMRWCLLVLWAPPLVDCVALFHQKELSMSLNSTIAWILPYFIYFILFIFIFIFLACRISFGLNLSIMLELSAATHYYPRRWIGQEHTAATVSDIKKLYPYSFVTFFWEVCHCCDLVNLFIFLTLQILGIFIAPLQMISMSRNAGLLVLLSFDLLVLIIRKYPQLY